MKKFLTAVLTMLTFLLTAAAACAANKEVNRYPVTVSRADGVGFAVTSYQDARSNCYLFLPAYMNGQELTLSLPEGMELEADGVRVQSGASVKLTGGTEVQLITARGKVALHILASALPSLHLMLEDGGLDRVAKDKDHKEPADLMAMGADGTVLYDGALKNMRGHGNAAFQFLKKSYQIHFEKKTGLLGLPEQKKLILLANHHENSLLRNRITFDLANAVGLRYTPHCASVDLYANGKYLENYLLCNKVDVASGSVDITDLDELNAEANGNPEQLPEAAGSRKTKKGTWKGIGWAQEPEDVTGGYLFSLEYEIRYRNYTASGVITKLRGQTVAVKSPETMSPGQGKYLLDLLDSMERAIYSKDGTDPQTGRHYMDIIDLDSFVRKYMIEEISHNYDSSQYFYKDADSVDPHIYAGPVWDYDCAWGGFSGMNRVDVGPKGILAAANRSSNNWWLALYAQPEFLERVKELWKTEFRPRLQVMTGDAPPWEGCGVTPLPELQRQMEASAQMNFTKWRVLNSRDYALKTGATYDANIDYLTGWIRQRIDFLDTLWN